MMQGPPPESARRGPGQDPQAQAAEEVARSAGMPRLLVAGALCLALVGVVAILVIAGKSNTGEDGATSAGAAATPRPTSVPTAVAQGLRQQAEARELPRATPPLADLIRGQAWYDQMTPAHLNLVAQLVRTEQTAKSRGEGKSVTDVLQFALEQAWYADGLDEREASGLSGVLQAYALSLTKDYAPAVGPVLSTTLRYQLFDVVGLPESGDKVVVVASQDEALGRRTLQLVSENLPRLEALIGKYPYPFVYLQVTKTLPEEVAGTSYDEFIDVGADSVDAETVIHELTHTTVYGKFPVWFEEGLAWFMESYLTDKLDRQASDFLTQMRRARIDDRLDVRAVVAYTAAAYMIETAQGYLFVKNLYELEGIESLSATVKNLRTKTYNDQELLTAIMQQAPENLQMQMRKLYCDRVVGTVRNYCVAGG